ncbi:MAG: hypothetical protein NZO58_10790, partial [Gemmataceae bacterium]|nr:hypothetical protein [Gemmataceae bacterium]
MAVGSRRLNFRFTMKKQECIYPLVLRDGRCRRRTPAPGIERKFIMAWLLVGLIAGLGDPLQADGPAEYKQHTVMPKRPTAVADYESMWDPYA